MLRSIQSLAPPSGTHRRGRIQDLPQWLKRWTRGMLVAFGLAAVSTVPAATMAYKTVSIDGVDVAYREAGAGQKTTILFLHGVPSSSRMYDGLMRKLGNKYHVVALDYPGFGNSDAPAPDKFTYTFDRLSEIVLKFTDALKMQRYVLFMQDYGAPVGMRVAETRPQAVLAMVFQNGNVYEEGLGPMWAKRRDFWRDRAFYEKLMQEQHLSLPVTRGRHIGNDPNVEAYDPDLWQDELAYLNRPGQAEIQSQLIYDYQTNIAAYPRWQEWLRTKRPPLLVVWGKYDPAFLVPGAEAFKRDVPQAEIHIMDGGHFLMDTRLDEVASFTRQFLRKQNF